MTTHTDIKKPAQFHLRGIKKLIARVLHKFLRKKGVWAFYSDSRKPWCGNLKAVCDVAANDSRLKEIIVFNFGTTSNRAIQEQYSDSLIPIIVNSSNRFDLFWSAIKSEIIFVTEYSKYGFPGKSVNLWHGIPLKKIGLFSNNMRKEASPWRVKDAAKRFANKIRTHNLVISSSRHDQVVMSACFGIHPDKVLNSGLPRNDWLTGSQIFPREYQAALEDLKVLCQGRKLCFYAPTFRDEYRTGAVVKPEELARISNIVYKNGMILGYRPHLTVGASNVVSEINYIDLSADIFPEIQIILQHASVLITDYSSCALDYMLLNRPIISYAPDLDSYSRGFLYDFSSVFPGKVIADFEEFIVELAQVASSFGSKSVSSNSTYNRLIQTRKHLFHDDRDSSFSSTQMLIDRALGL